MQHAARKLESEALTQFDRGDLVLQERQHTHQYTQALASTNT